MEDLKIPLLASSHHPPPHNEQQSPPHNEQPSPSPPHNTPLSSQNPCRVMVVYEPVISETPHPHTFSAGDLPFLAETGDRPIPTETGNPHFSTETLVSDISQKLVSTILQNLDPAIISQNIASALSSQNIASSSSVSLNPAEIVVSIINELLPNLEARIQQSSVTTTTPALHFVPSQNSPKFEEEDKEMFRELENAGLIKMAIEYYYEKAKLDLPTREWYYPLSGTFGLSDMQSDELMDCIMVHVEDGARPKKPLKTVKDLKVFPDRYPSVDQTFRHQLHRNFWRRTRYAVVYLVVALITWLFYVVLAKYINFQSLAPSPS